MTLKPKLPVLLAFLNAQLKSDKSTLLELVKNHSYKPFEQDKPDFTYGFKGITKRNTTNTISAFLLNRERFADCRVKKGIDAEITILDSSKNERNSDPIYDELFVFSRINDLLNIHKKYCS